MNGTTYRRKNGTWAFSLYLGRVNGKQQRLFHGGFKTKREADDAKNDALKDLKDGLAVKPSPRTFGEFMDQWFEEYAVRHCERKPTERYRQLWQYVHQDLKALKIGEVSALALEREYNRLLDSGGRDRKTKKPRPLSGKTVRDIAVLIRGALNKALTWKLIRSNPAVACSLPKIVKQEPKALDETQTAWYLAAAQGHWLYPILLVAAATGGRRGELLALTWRDVDMTSRFIRFSKSLEQTKAGLRIKTTKSEKPRDLRLPDLAVEGLTAHKAEQEKSRAAFGADYRTDLDLVFCSPEGNYLKPDSVIGTACAIAKKAGLKRISLHSLRHSHVSQLLGEGIPLPAVSKRLGHASTHVTAKIYAHSFGRDDIAAAEVWNTKMRRVLDFESKKPRQ
jgi:integrase